MGTNIQVVTASAREIKSRKTEVTKNNKRIVYEIPCSVCDSRYYGESSRVLAERLKEHKADHKHHREKSALVNYTDEKGHPPK